MKSQPVALLGEAPPRVLVEPAGVRANSWEDVADLSARAGIVLDEWQERILRAAMGERADATWAAKRVGVSVARQNGKSQLLVARALAGVLLFGELKIVISAHQQDTARETFSKLVEILEADGNAWLMDRVKPGGIMSAINREAVKFKNGATIQFKARTGAGGRGFSSDCLLLDEAQRLKRSSWVSINSTMSAMPNPQVWLLGTPPTPEDDGEVFESIRTAAIDGGSTASAWAEWGGDTSTDEYKAAKDDIAAKRWSAAVEYLCWSANPAWNTRINREVVEGELESYTEDEFAQDRVGMWLSDLGVGGTRAISERDWSAVAVDEKPDGEPTFAVAFSIDGMRLALAGAVKHEQGVHVELLDVFSGAVEGGLAPLADWFCARDADGVPRWKRSGGIVLSGRAGAQVLAQLLYERRVPPRKITIASSPQYFQACGMFDEAVTQAAAAIGRGEVPAVTHLAGAGQAALDASVAITDKQKRTRDGAWGWHATTPFGDETPVEAVSLAHWAARMRRARSTDSSSSAAGRRVVVMGR